MDNTNPLAAPTATNPTPWRGKPRHPLNPMRWFRRWVPVGYEWTCLAIVTGQVWLAIPMYFFDRRRLHLKWDKAVQPEQHRQRDCAATRARRWPSPSSESAVRVNGDYPSTVVWRRLRMKRRAIGVRHQHAQAHFRERGTT